MMSKLLKIARQIKSSNFCIPPPHTPPPPMTETCVFRNLKILNIFSGPWKPFKPLEQKRKKEGAGGERATPRVLN